MYNSASFTMNVGSVYSYYVDLQFSLIDPLWMVDYTYAEHDFRAQLIFKGTDYTKINP